MKYRIFLILLFTPLIASAHFKTGNQLKSSCSDTNAVNVALCYGYAQGVVDAYGGSGFCPPAEITTEQVTSIITKYFNEYPERLHYSASSLIKDAMIKAFPCAGRR